MTSRSEIAARLDELLAELKSRPTYLAYGEPKDMGNSQLLAAALAASQELVAELEAKVAGLERLLGDADEIIIWMSGAPGFGPNGQAHQGWLKMQERIIEIRAALAGTSDTGEVESGWVIEGAWSPTSAPEYWCGSSRWSSDHRRALRFARQQDACQASNMMLDGILVRVSEHEWVRENACAHQWEIVHAVDICKLCGMGRT